MAFAMASTSTSLRTPAVQRRAAAPRSLRVCCQAGRPMEQRTDLKAAVAGFAAAAMLLAGSANAGVVLEKADVKKVFQGEASTPAKTATPEAPKAPKPKKDEYIETGGFDPRGLILPLTLVGIPGAGFALSKIDPVFEDLFKATVIKDANVDGAGYEVVLKDGTLAAKGGKAGTRKVAPKKK